MSDPILTDEEKAKMIAATGGINFGGTDDFIFGGQLPNAIDVIGQRANFPDFSDLQAFRDIQPDITGFSDIDLGDLDIPDAVTLLSQADQNAMAALQAEARKVLEQEKAAQAYADLVLGSQPTTAKQFADIEKAKQALIDLDVSREQIEAAKDPLNLGRSVDTSQGISGVMGPNLKGAIDIAGDFVVDKFGTGALQALGAYGELFGADKDRLLQDTKVGVNPIGPGLSYIFGDDGKVKTTPLGTTSTGNPVVLSGPIGAAGSVIGDILSGDVDIFGLPGAIVDSVGGLGGAVQTAAQTGALGLDDSREPGGDVVLDEASILASILADDDTVTGGDGNDTLADTVTGGDGNDTLADTVTGGDGNDTLADTVIGGDGNDTLVDTVIGGAGNDTLVDTTKSDKFTGAGETTTKVGPPLIFVPPGGTPPGGTPPDGGDEDDDEEIIETLLTEGDGDPEVEEEIIETTTETPEPTKTTATTTGGGGGGGTLRLPPRLRGVREQPGDVVDIDYLYDFAKGLDQPFLTTNEDDEVKNLSVFAEGGPTDAVDMLTRPRRPGEYGRRYFEDAVFTPTGTALGGEALDPTKIQIPQYKFERDLLPQFKMPTQTMPSSAAVPMDAVSYTATPNEDIDVDTLLELVGLIGMEGLGFAAGGMAMGGPNYLAGATDGMADLIPATIGGTQPAALSDGEFVIPADVVSHLGNGNSDAGAKELYAMMDRVRDERTGTTKQGPEINPTKMMPA